MPCVKGIEYLSAAPNPVAGTPLEPVSRDTTRPISNHRWSCATFLTDEVDGPHLSLCHRDWSTAAGRVCAIEHMHPAVALVASMLHRFT